MTSNEQAGEMAAKSGNGVMKWRKISGAEENRKAEKEAMASAASGENSENDSEK